MSSSAGCRPGSGAKGVQTFATLGRVDAAPILGAVHAANAQEQSEFPRVRVISVRRYDEPTDCAFALAEAAIGLEAKHLSCNAAGRRALRIFRGSGAERQPATPQADALPRP